MSQKPELQARNSGAGVDAVAISGDSYLPEQEPRQSVHTRTKWIIKIVMESQNRLVN